MVTWLESVTESVEASPEQARKLFTVDGRRLHSLANVKRWILSELELPTLAALYSLARNTDWEVRGTLRSTIFAVQKPPPTIPFKCNGGGAISFLDSVIGIVYHRAA